MKSSSIVLREGFYKFDCILVYQRDFLGIERLRKSLFQPYIGSHPLEGILHEAFKKP